MKIKKVSIGADPALTGAAHIPAKVKACAVIAHPHPAYGGTMENDVVVAACDVLARQGYFCLRFNFRGVGGSEGVSRGDAGEVEDLLQVLGYLEHTPETRGLPIVIGGYSYGGWIALRAAAEYGAHAATLVISPPLSMFPHDIVRLVSKPICFFSGDQDMFCSTNDLADLLEIHQGTHELHIIRGADHFWFAHLNELAAKIEECVNGIMK